MKFLKVSNMKFLLPISCLRCIHLKIRFFWNTGTVLVECPTPPITDIGLSRNLTQVVRIRVYPFGAIGLLRSKWSNGRVSDS